MKQDARTGGRAGWLGVVLAGTVLALAPGPAVAWTPQSQLLIGESAAQMTPPDLRRQIAKHRGAFRKGLVAPFQDGDPARHRVNPDGSGKLDRVIHYEADGVVKAIQAHRPMEEIVYRLGVLSHYLADASNPLNADASDPMEPRFYEDFLRYLESTEPRIETVFYGLRPEIQAAPDLRPLVAESLARSRKLYPLVGKEYRRIGTIDGRRLFDDRSTAFGVASLCFSHALSDIAEAFRILWIRAGGIDQRRVLPERGDTVVLLPKPDPWVAEPGAAR